MSTIKEFKALHPKMPWYQELFNAVSGKCILQHVLEPSRLKDHDDKNFKQIEENLNSLINNKNYILEEEPGIYVYEHQTGAGSQFGIWALTNIEDLINGLIVTHEDTLVERAQRLTNYRMNVGLEGGPVLLTYQRDREIVSLIETVAYEVPNLCFQQENRIHKLWKIQESDVIKKLKVAFDKIDRVYVADGHHRLKAASLLHSSCPQWISTLYISSGQLACREFHRKVIPDTPISKIAFMGFLSDYFYLSEIPQNIPYRPGKAHRLGLCFEGIWHQLDLKPELEKLQPLFDVQILQHNILAPFFEIKDPTNDERLISIPADKWTDLVADSRKEPTSIFFTLFPISANQLINLSETKGILPPKSTYIEPKVPFGLMLYSERIMKPIAHIQHV